MRRTHSATAVCSSSVQDNTAMGAAVSRGGTGKPWLRRARNSSSPTARATRWRSARGSPAGGSATPGSDPVASPLAPASRSMPRLARARRRTGNWSGWTTAARDDTVRSSARERGGLVGGSPRGALQKEHGAHGRRGACPGEAGEFLSPDAGKGLSRHRLQEGEGGCKLVPLIARPLDQVRLNLPDAGKRGERGCDTSQAQEVGAVTCRRHDEAQPRW